MAIIIATTWQPIINARVETNEETSVREQPGYLRGQQWLLCSLFAKDLPLFIPLFMALSYKELVKPMRWRPTGQHLTTHVAMLDSGKFKSNTKKVHDPYLVCSLWPHSSVRFINPPFPVLSAKVMTDKPEKQRVLPLPLSLSTRTKLHQWVMRMASTEQHTEHMPERPSVQRVISVTIMSVKQGSTKCPSEVSGNAQLKKKRKKTFWIEFQDNSRIFG